MNRKALLRILIIVTPLIVIATLALLWTGSGGGQTAEAEIQRQFTDVKPFVASRFMSQNLEENYMRPALRQEVHKESFEIASEGIEISGGGSSSGVLQKLRGDLAESIETEMQTILGEIVVGNGCDLIKEGSDFSVSVDRVRSGSSDSYIGLDVDNQGDPLAVSCDSGTARFRSYFSIGGEILVEENRLFEAADIAADLKEAIRGKKEVDTEEIERSYEENYRKDNERYRGFDVEVVETDKGFRVEVKDDRYRIPVPGGYKRLSLVLEP